MLDNLRIKLLGLPRRYKRMLQVAADVTLVWLSLWLAFLVRLGTEDMISPFSGHAWLFIAAPLVAIPLFIRFGMYRAVMRYLGNDALIAIAKAVTISALVLSLLVYWYRSPPAVVPRSLVFNYWWLSMLLIGGLRLAMRQYFMGDWYSAVQSVPFLNRQDGLPRVAIYGAGAAGNQLVAALRLGRAMRPVAFIDDDKQIANRWDLAQEVGGVRTLVRGADAGGGSDQVGTYGGDVADGRPAVAVADQVDLGLAAEGDDFLHLLQQLLAADFRGVQLADFGDVDLGTVTAQGAGNAEPVVDPEDVVEAEHAVGQHDGVFGLGVGAGLDQRAGSERGETDGQAEGEQRLLLHVVLISG